jgi:TDG/mug DNA glycosylase family protein
MRGAAPSSFEGTVPDVLGPNVRLLFVGVNPGRTAVATQAPFAGRGNRFYVALHLAGITDHVIETSGGLDRADRDHLLTIGIGITSLVARATASAVELGAAELVAGAESLSRRVAQLKPRVVAILGITAYRVAFGQRGARVGRQPRDVGGAQLWVVPNPSGRNARASMGSLAVAYREVAVAAGLAVSCASG